ncbi:flagellar hook-basal body protein [Bacillus sp. T3]|uniref:flagellar hook-basal body protein n=1 Tax=Bacillus sp. T3 TaxID=467262 RepID=UPI0029819F4B|nr:flagellar hook-basal body protein [Bacillus sp. T3]
MNTSMSISAGSLRAYQQKLDTISNNIANVNTTGFKRREQSFSEILASQVNNQPRTDQELGRLTPNGIRVGYGTRTGLTQLDETQGQAIKTDNPLGMMIQGKGYFQISVPSQTPGAAREVRYTRDGNFQVSPNPDIPGMYNIVHPNGGYLLDQAGNPILLNDQYDVQVNSSGEILLKNKNGSGVPFNSGERVGIVEIQNPQTLRGLGGNQFAIDPAAGGNAGVRMMGLDEVEVASGYLEGSNVDLTTEMSDLMLTQRGFQLNSRALSYSEQMLGIANGIMK